MFAAERGHIHHRLLDRGLSHPQAVMVLHLVSLAAVCIGCVSLLFEDWATLGGLALLIPLYWGLLQLAGSMRTNEMMTALRTKRDFDRTARRYRSTFEDMQLEFHHVKNFSQWWEGVCRAAHRLEFINVNLRLPGADGSDSAVDCERELRWNTDCPKLPLCNSVRASIPVLITDADGPTATISVQIAAPHSLESAGQRLALFSRLITEYSIAKVRKLEAESRRLRQLRSTKNSGAQVNLSDLTLLDTSEFARLRVAVVHDFLYTYAGAERVLEQIINIVPHCDLYAVFDFLSDGERKFLQQKRATTTFIQKLPLARKFYRYYLPFMPLAIEQLNLSNYD